MKKKITGTPDSKNEGQSKPIKTKEQVQQSNDERIDQDFPGFPHAPSTEEAVKTKGKATAKT